MGTTIVVVLTVGFAIFCAGVRVGKGLLMKDLESDGYLVKWKYISGTKFYEIYAKRGLFYQYVPAKR